MRTWLHAFGAAFILSACASPQAAAPTVKPMQLPTNAEVQAYVAEHWADFSRYALVYARRYEKTPSLQSVEDVSCGYFPESSELALCYFEATVMFADGQSGRQRMNSHFRRDKAGKLERRIIVVTAPPKQ
jgi:hypothetical protein